MCWVPSKTDGWEKYIPCLYKNSGKCLFEEFRSLVILALTWNLLGTQLVSRVVLFTAAQTVCPKYSFGKRVDAGATKHTGSERLGQIAAAPPAAPAPQSRGASTGLRWKQGAASLGHPFCGAVPRYPRSRPALLRCPPSPLACARRFFHKPMKAEIWLATGNQAWQRVGTRGRKGMSWAVDSFELRSLLLQTNK